MSKKKNKKTNPIASFGGKAIDLVKFNTETDKQQYEIIEKLLKEIYKEHLPITKKQVLKVIRLTLNPKDNFIYLPNNLKISKEKLELKFKVTKKKDISTGWIIFALWLLIFALIGATYAGVRYMSLANLNKDIDDDGVADINIDINADYKAEINIDSDDDDKPDINVDYKGNRRAMFNIDIDGDGKADLNLVNNAVENKECTYNCDLNGDGWPDMNIDFDGDGVVDTDKDTDNDGIADLNLDLNGDGRCDIMCDEDNDNKCDNNCIPGSQEGIGTGSSSVTGDPTTDTITSTLVIRFIDGETVNVDALMPDDQPVIDGVEFIQPYKTFIVENLSNYPMVYSLKWDVQYNTFVSNNFKFNLSSTNGAPNFGYKVVPRTNEYIVQNVVIPARVSQKYTITFNLEGTGKPQNEDQGKTFKGKIHIEV